MPANVAQTEELIEIIRTKLYTAVVSDVLDRHGYLEQAMDARIRPIDEVRSGYYLNVEVFDRPGVLAAMGSVLAQQNVNISDVSLGRCQDSGDALTVIRIDGDISPEALDALRNLPVVQTVKVVQVDLRTNSGTQSISVVGEDSVDTLLRALESSQLASR